MYFHRTTKITIYDSNFVIFIHLLQNHSHYCTMPYNHSHQTGQFDNFTTNSTVLINDYISKHDLHRKICYSEPTAMMELLTIYELYEHQDEFPTALTSPCQQVNTSFDMMGVNSDINFITTEAN